MKKFNVLEHELVPEHYLVPREEEEKILQELSVDKSLLPKIYRSDPAVKMLEKIYGPIESGRIVKIIRNSAVAGKTIVYRTVVEQ
ncbi:MAG: DNA-directed RNA polymerase subunit H [Thermoplasmata archaeon]